MAVVITNANEVINKLVKFGRNISRGKEKTVKEVARVGKRIAQGLAPRRTGALVRGIRSKSYPKTGRAEIISLNPSRENPRKRGFPYNKWVNRDPSVRSIMLAGRERIYGDGDMNITGTPEFMNLTYDALKEIFPRLTRNMVSKAVRDFNR